MKLILITMTAILLTGCATVDNQGQYSDSKIEYLINVINNRDFGFR